MVVSFLSTLSYFFIVKTTETRDVYASQKSPFGCMLFNYFNIYLLRCLRVLPTHATPTFPDFNMNVYSMKHERL